MCCVFEEIVICAFEFVDRVCYVGHAVRHVFYLLSNLNLL